MKNFMLISIFLSFTFSVLSQNIEPAPQDKAVIYFVRTVKGGFGSFAAPIVFDADNVIGMLTYRNFIRYECEPGKHMLWSLRSLSTTTFTHYKQFIDADLLAGKIYLVEIRLQMEGIHMDPIDPINNEKELLRVKEVLNNKSSIKAHKLMAKKNYRADKIHKSYSKKGINKYEKFDEKGKVKLLHPEWFLGVEDLKLDKKDKPVSSGPT